MTVVFSLFHQFVLILGFVYLFRLRFVNEFPWSSLIKDIIIGICFGLIVAMLNIFPMTQINRTVSLSVVVLALISYFCGWRIVAISIIVGLAVLWRQLPQTSTGNLNFIALTNLIACLFGLGWKKEFRNFHISFFAFLGGMCTILVGFYQILLLQKLDFEIFFIYPFFAVFIAYLLYRERSPSSKDVSENEELNLQNALEIHDNLTQIMFSANTMIATLPQLLEKKPENANTYLKNLKQFTNDVMASLQLLEFELNPALLEQTELSILLKYLGDSVRSGENIEFNYIILDRIMLNDGRHKYVYRIVQEALKNAVTHANTSKIEIKLMRVNQLFEVTIYDNGIGFDSKLQLEEQSGIQLMRRYARLSNTELEITSPVGDGTSVKLRG